MAFPSGAASSFAKRVFRSVTPPPTAVPMSSKNSPPPLDLLKDYVACVFAICGKQQLCEFIIGERCKRQLGGRPFRTAPTTIILSHATSLLRTAPQLDAVRFCL